MYHFICDMCGKGLLLDDNVRYEVTIEVKSAYDPMDIVRNDLDRDLQNEFLNLIEQLKHRDQQELDDEVYKVFKFDLCLSCQKKFIRNPLSKEVMKE
ncbi:MAG: hypothetical protein WC980_08535 [Candidatus Brocadiia bacterium]